MFMYLLMNELFKTFSCTGIKHPDINGPCES